VRKVGGQPALKPRPAKIGGTENFSLFPPAGNGHPDAQLQPEITRFKLAPDERKKIWAAALAQLMQEGLEQNERRIFEASPADLADDITIGLRLAGLLDDLTAHCRSVVFAPDIFNQSGERKDSYIEGFVPGRTTVNRRIFVNARFGDGRFLQGLDYYHPLASSVIILKAAEQIKGIKDQNVLPFVFSLHSALAIRKILAAAPSDLPGWDKMKTDLEGRLEVFVSRAKMDLSMSDLLQLPDEIVHLYTTLTKGSTFN
jgi:hypothetical protein